jgi:Zn-dependent metalloprotease
MTILSTQLTDFLSPTMHQLRAASGCCCFIIPPDILTRLAESDDSAKRNQALDSLDLSARMRGRREAMAGMAASLAVATGTKRRTIYDALNRRSLPGKLARGEGDPRSKDVAINEAYDGAGKTYDFFSKVCARNSIDNRGMRLDSTVHYGSDYQNAFWDGQQMVYGDGDGEIFHRFTRSLDVIGHELTHGVTEFEAGLVYEDQPGALNEHFSDVFGSLVKQYAKKQTAAKADWLIGVGLFTKAVKGAAIRSMKAPGTAYDDPSIGKDPQPAHMKDFVKTTRDHGGVHINSGIPNKAFYEAAIRLGGNAWDKAGRIWYETLINRMNTHSSFQDCAKATFDVAAQLFGLDSVEQRAIREAWDAVGFKVGGTGATKAKK